MSGEKPEETRIHPPLTYKESRSYILTPLPEGFYFYQQKNRERDGKCPCVFQWKGQDPPPLVGEKRLAKSRSVVPLRDEEFEELKLLFDNRLVVSPLEKTLKSELDILLENRLKEQDKNFSDDLNETKKKILDKLEKEIKAVREAISGRLFGGKDEKGGETPASQGVLGTFLNSINKRLDRLERGLERGAIELKPENDFESSVDVDPEKLMKTYNSLLKKEIDIEQVGRVISADPHIMLYYAYAKSELDYDGDLPDFMRDTIVSYFGSLSPPVRLGFILGGSEIIVRRKEEE